MDGGYEHHMQLQSYILYTLDTVCLSSMVPSFSFHFSFCIFKMGMVIIPIGMTTVLCNIMRANEVYASTFFSLHVTECAVMCFQLNRNKVCRFITILSRGEEYCLLIITSIWTFSSHSYFEDFRRLEIQRTKSIWSLTVVV